MSEEKARPVIGVSILSYGLVGAWLPALASRWAKRDGFDGLQMLPVVGYIPGLLGLPILTYEDVWCPGNIPQMWLAGRRRRQVGPTILDLLLFPWFYWWQLRLLRHLQASGARLIEHERHHDSSTTPPALLEIHPELQASEKEIRRWERELVLDTYHVRRPPKDDSQVSRLGTPDYVVRVLAHQIRVVHVSPYRGSWKDSWEAESFARGDWTPLDDMISNINRCCQVDCWIVEIPPLLSPGKNRDLLRRFRIELAKKLAG